MTAKHHDTDETHTGRLTSDTQTQTDSYALDGMLQTTQCAGCVLKQLFTVSHSAAYRARDESAL